MHARNHDVKYHEDLIKIHSLVCVVFSVTFVRLMNNVMNAEKL